MASDRIWRDRSKKTVILDSNAIMMLFEFQINLEEELTRLIGKYRIIVPQPIYDELVFLSENGKGSKKIKAKASIDLIKKYEIVNIDDENADDSVLSLAKKVNGFVVTNDKELIKRLKNDSVKVIFLRSKKKLEIK